MSVKKTYNTISFSQPGGVFYVCAIPANEIIHKLEIRRRKDNEYIGIQRDADKKRISQISTYLESPSAILPTSIIVSAYDNAVSLNKDGSIELNQEIDIYGHILDGQHRVMGLKEIDREHLIKIELLVQFVFGIDPYSEATIFTTINSNQKQVSKSLIYDLFDLNPARSIEKVGHEISKSLNEDTDSPFYQKIKMLGKKAGDNETLSQAALIDYMIAVAKSKDSIFNYFYVKGEDWAIRKIMVNVFSGMDIAFGNIKNQYPPDYFYKTTGYGGVMKSLNRLLDMRRNEKNYSKEYFTEIFNNFLKANPDSIPGTGGSAMNDIKNKILQSNNI